MSVQLPPMSRDRSVATLAPKAAINTKKVQRIVWIAFQEHINPKNNRQSVSSVLLEKLPPTSRDNLIATLAPKDDINKHEVQQSV
jgi:hypothetical protein